MADKSSGPPAWVKWCAVLIGLLGATLAALWLSGAFLFLLHKKNPLGLVELGTWFRYWELGQGNPELVKKLKASAVVGALLGYGVPLLVLFKALHKPRKLHGDAKFASPAEVKEAKLLEHGGILVGKYRGKYLSFGGQQFAMVAAPTRSGKGVGVVIPNLLSYPDSVVVLDIKQENYDLTAGFRAKHGQKVYLFNPFAEDKRSHRYNPLGYVRDGEYRIGDLQTIAAILFPADTKDNFWNEAAANLFLGLGLYLCETPSRPRTLGELLRLASGDGKSISNYLRGLLQERADQGNPLSRACAEALNRFCSNSSNTLASILSTFTAALGLWANPFVDAATAANDFDLRDLRKKKMSVYVGITPDHLHEVGRLLNLFFSQLVSLNTSELPSKNKSLKHSCLLLLDEFTAIGKIQILAKAVSYIAGYWLRLLPIIQSKSQLVSVYGPEDAQTFMANHALQVVFAPQDQKDAKDYSEILGYETVATRSKSRSYGGKGGASRGESVSEQQRALLLPQELRALGQAKEIVLLENVKPIQAEKIRYYEDPNFSSRVLPAPPVPLLEINTKFEPFIPPASEPSDHSEQEEGSSSAALSGLLREISRSSKKQKEK